MSRVRPFGDEHARALINLRPRYEALIEAERGLAELPYNLVCKRVGDREYLYEVLGPANNGKSLGRMSPELEQRLADYRTVKHDLQQRRTKAQGLVHEIGCLARDKDRQQGQALIDAVAEAMPHYPLDADFERNLPPELKQHFEVWQGRRSTLN